MRDISDIGGSSDALDSVSAFAWPSAPAVIPPSYATRESAAAGGSGFQINLIFDAPISTLPTDFVAGIQLAAARFEAMFTDNITLNLHIGFGESGGDTLGANTLGESNFSLNTMSPGQVATVDPFVDRAFAQSFSSIFLSTAQIAAFQAAQGFTPAAPNASVGFSKTASFDYDDSDGVSAGKFDFFGTFAHEVTETMGRIAGLADPNSGLNFPTILDLFRFMNGQHDLSNTDPTYFSVDGSATGFDFNLVPKNDVGDWATESSVGHDSFLAVSSSSHENVLSIFDLQLMQALGWHIANAPAAGASGLFLGTTGADNLVGSGGDDTLVGGPGSDHLTGGGGNDTFVYQFASDSTPNAFDIIQDFQTGHDKIDLLAIQPSAVSVVRSNGVSFVFVSTPGGSMTIAANGDVNGTDFLTGGTNHGGVYLIADNNGDVLIGSSAGDPIQGGNGNDVITGGGGGDAIFGGAGTNTFLYQAYSDSTAAAADGIFDFKTGIDRIDLTALNTTAVSLIRSGGSTFLFASGPNGELLQINSAFHDVNGSDILTGSTHGVYLIGDNAGDTLIGSANSDPIQGGSGNDLIIGGGGGDALFGGGGANTFKYLAASDSTATASDSIFDFKAGIDKIDLSAVRESSTDVFGILSQSGSSFLFVKLDPGQADEHDMTIILNGTPSITANDIIWGTAPTHDITAVATSPIGETMPTAKTSGSDDGSVTHSLLDSGSHLTVADVMPTPNHLVDEHYFLSPLNQHVAELVA